MRAYVLSIGSELVLGHLTDTNATFLAQELATLGIELLHVVHVGDDRARIARTIERALAEAELVVCTGGVGPTEDDLTREAIADVAGEEPIVDPGLAATIELFFAARGLTMPERNRKQAWVIPSAEPLPNPVGTAPGWYVRIGRGIVVAMPGVPREMTRMWADQVVPRLRERLPERVVSSVTLKTIGIGESAAEQALDGLVARDNPVVATYAKDDGVHIRITGVAAVEAEARRLRDEAAAEVRHRLSRYVYGDDGLSLADALLLPLRARRQTLAVVDEGGGGRFGSLVQASPVSLDTVLAGLARPRGEAEVVRLAAEARDRFPADLGVGIAVDAEREPDGLYRGQISVAVLGPADRTEVFPMRAAFEELQRRSGLIAADVVWRAILGVP